MEHFLYFRVKLNHFSLKGINIYSFYWSLYTKLQVWKLNILLCVTYKIWKKMADYRLFSPPGVVAMGNAQSSGMSWLNLKDGNLTLNKGRFCTSDAKKMDKTACSPKLMSQENSHRNQDWCIMKKWERHFTRFIAKRIFSNSRNFFIPYKNMLNRTLSKLAIKMKAFQSVLAASGLCRQIWQTDWPKLMLGRLSSACVASVSASCMHTYMFTNKVKYEF